MIFPLVFLFGGLLAIHALARRGLLAPPTNPPTVSKGVVSQTQRLSQAERFKRQRPYLYALLVTVKRGLQPDPWLINEAMAEAYDRGNWKLVANLHRRYGALDRGEDYPEEQPEEGGEEGEENEPIDQWGEDEAIDSSETGQDENESGDMPTDIVIGKNSPFEGVPNDAWDRFVSSLETEKPDYEGPKHVGRYHHSKERLSQLKIDDVSTPEKQYDALVKDLADSREKSGALIREFELTPIQIDGGEQIATLSGILAVVKSAGLDHARSWFTNPEDRKKFPKTSEMFIKANGAF